MKVIFMGTPDFSVGTLEAIIEAGHEVVGVFTQPDKPKGRGKSVVFPPVKEIALKYDLDVYQPIKIREPEYVELVKKLNPDIIIVVAFGQLLPKEILDIPKYGCVNVHASLLPKYRGAAPIQWAVINGEEESGVTTMLMDVGLDTGDIIMKKSIKLEKDETGGSLFDKLAIEGARLCVETMKAIESGEATYEKQDDSKATFTKQFNKAFGKIDWNMDAVAIERLVRGLNPWPSAYTTMNDKTMKIWAADVIEKDATGENGEIINITKDSLEVKTQKGILVIKELQMEGKKRMTTDAYLRGASVDVGTVLK